MRPLKDKTKEDLEWMIGQVVQKVSGKPFKGGMSIDTIESITTHPRTGRVAFSLRFSESVIEAQQCKLEREERHED